MSRRDREVRRIGVNVGVLLMLSVVAAILLAHSSHLDVSATVLSLVVGGVAPVGMYMTWEGLRQSSRSVAQTATPASGADELAEVVEDQWEKEYQVRKFNDPTRQLAVSWSAADRSLTVRWDELVREATRGFGAQKDPRPGNWAPGPQGLTGLEDELPAVLERVPTGWLVVLGGPGYGKSMLMLRLVLDLLKQREPGGPVPVFVSMASWDPEADDLRTWLQRQLPIDYPGLDAMVSSDEGENSRITALLARQKIVPILDGLDEMPPASRKQAVGRLNEAVARPDRPLRLVMTCRTEEYHGVVGRPGEPWNPVRGAAVVQLHALDPDKVAAYLGEREKDPRWAAVVKELRKPGAPLAEALRTPLYASLASAIYNLHRYQLRGQAPAPEDLCKFPNAKSIQDHLLDEFIPALYPAERRAQERRAREDDEDPGQLPAERWLMFLARYLTYGRKEHATSLRWWDLKGLAPDRLAPAVVGTVSGMAVGIASCTGTHVGVGIGIGIGTGMLIAMAIGLGTRSARRRWDPKGYIKHYKKRRPGPGMAGGMIGAVIGGLGAGAAGKYGIGNEQSLFSGLPEALGIGIGAGASTEFFGGLVGTLIGSFVAGYLAAVGLGLPAGLVNGLGVGLAAGLVVEHVGRQAPARRRPRWEKEIGIPGGLVVGLVMGFIAGREEGVVVGIVAAVVLGAAVALPFGLRHIDEDLALVPSPGQALARDAAAFRLTAISAGLAAGFAGFIGVGMTSIFEVGAKASLSAVVSNGLGIGLASGLVIGLTFGFYHAASPEFRIIIWWLALQRKAPWQLKRFLEDAHRKSVLRQSGASYEFRHEVLQRRLADRLKAEQQGGAASSRPAGEVPDQRVRRRAYRAGRSC